MKNIAQSVLLIVLFQLVTLSGAQMSEPTEIEKVTLHTTHGEITLALDPVRAPITVQNFLRYIKDGHYDGTIFHRVIDGFMIQGGGMKADLQEKNTHPPIKNEADNGVKNKRGTIAMARTNLVDSATSQFFINLVDNSFLDYRGDAAHLFGYCVFGKVVQGMEAVDKIGKSKTGNRGRHGDVPLETILIEKAIIH